MATPTAQAEIAPSQMAAALALACGRRRLHARSIEVAKSGVTCQSGQPAPGPELLERRRATRPPGGQVDDRVAHLTQGAPPAYQVSLLHHTRSDARGDGQVGDVVVPDARTEQRLAHRGEVGVVRHGHRLVEVRPQLVLAQELGPALGQVRRPQQPPELVVDGPGEADDGVRHWTVRILRAHGAQQVDQHAGDFGVVGSRRQPALEDPASTVHQSGAHHRAPDVCGQDRALAHHVEMA